MSRVYRIENVRGETNVSILDNDTSRRIVIESPDNKQYSLRAKISYSIIKDCLYKWDALKHYQELAWFVGAYFTDEKFEITEDRVKVLCRAWDVESFKRLV